MRILVLGHQGMLGRIVAKYLAGRKHTILIVASRWGETDFGKEILDISPDCIVNCIGKIPQKSPSQEEYEKVNIALPIFLETLNIPIIHPSTDCEFSGTLSLGKKYRKVDPRDAEDEYGKSKALISEKIEKEFKNTKIIRTSIIGHEEKTHFALLDWFLHSEGEVRGFTNHFWNGITTLEWAKRCEQLIHTWSQAPTLNQYGTNECISKFDLLHLLKEVYEKKIEIAPFATEVAINKCLESDRMLLPLKDQLNELKEFCGK
jgi:dTDP-4-dehydrorhamnose reductase